MKESKQPESSKTLFGLALKTSRRLFPKVLSPLFFTFALWVMMAAIAFVWPLSLILTFPLLFAPSSFALLLSVNVLNMGQEVSPSSYFLFFVRFFQRDIFGSYRLLRNFLLSLFLSFILSFLFGVLYFKGVSTIDPNLVEAVNLFVEYQKAGNGEALQKLLETDNSLLTFSFYLTTFSLSSFLLLYLHFFLRSGIVPLILRGSGSFPYRVRWAVYSMALRQKGVHYDAHYFSAMTLPYVLVLGFFALGAYLSSLFLEDVISQPLFITMGGVSGGLLGLLLVLPFYDEVLYGLAGRYEILFNKTSLLISEEALHQFSTMKNEADAQIRVAKQNIELVKKMMDMDTKKEGEEDPNKDVGVKSPEKEDKKDDKGPEDNLKK